MKRSFAVLLLSCAALSALNACVPVAATGLAATAGVASAQEGGIRGAVSDASIKGSINEKWFQYNIETFAKLSTRVDQGRVLLTGVVQNPADRVEAVRLVWQVPGVKQVINEIRVADSEGLPGFVRDNWISTRLRTAITLDRDIRSLNYSIDTVQGVVYLMGVAINQNELNKVNDIARTIPNVRQVVSYVKMIGEGVPDARGAASVDSAPPAPVYNNSAAGGTSSGTGGGGFYDSPQNEAYPSSGNSGGGSGGDPYGAFGGSPAPVTAEPL